MQPLDLKDEIAREYRILKADQEHLMELAHVDLQSHLSPEEFEVLRVTEWFDYRKRNERVTFHFLIGGIAPWIRWDGATWLVGEDTRTQLELPAGWKLKDLIQWYLTNCNRTESQQIISLYD